jgi:hypothetical protein
VKSETEDLESIIHGIMQKKGNVHIQFGKPLTEEEIQEASLCDKNDRYQSIRHAMDRRIIDGYKLWKTNYMAYDIVNGGAKYADQYSPEELQAFKGYIEALLEKVEPELNRDDLRDILLHIYSNPVLSKENLKDLV